MKKGRGKSAAARANNIGDILITNSLLNLSSAPVKKGMSETDYQMVKDNRIVGFIFSADGRRLKFFPIRLFKGDDFVDVTCTDAVGKFAFEGLKGGDYRLSTEDKNILIKVKA